jgi:hypothetical protein
MVRLPPAGAAGVITASACPPVVVTTIAVAGIVGFESEAYHSKVSVNADDSVHPHDEVLMHGYIEEGSIKEFNQALAESKTYTSPPI